MVSKAEHQVTQIGAEAGGGVVNGLLRGAHQQQEWSLINAQEGT